MNDNPKVLVVDDKEENLLVVESILEELPVKIVKVASGEEALKILLKEKISIILLDVKMPRMSGFETAEFIRESSKLKDLPIVFLSGSRENDYDKFLENYPHNVIYLQKPLKIEVIRALVSSYIN